LTAISDLVLREDGSRSEMLNPAALIRTLMRRLQMSERRPDHPHGGPPGQSGRPEGKPNIVYMMMDNLGWGEPGCYGGGILRGAPTPNIDKLAAEGTRLLNFNVESQCTPSRSAMMTGRFSIRSGTHSVAVGGGPDGLTTWEITIAKVLSDAGYATAHYGKWHLGSIPERYPTGLGFGEWYGIPRTSDEALWPEDPRAEGNVEFLHVVEGKAGEQSREVAVYDTEQRRLIDREITQRTIAFMSEHAGKKPFYAYVPYTQPHFPSLPHPDFAGKTGHGDFADVLAEMDHNVGEVVAAIDELGIADNTIVVFTSDNGPDPNWPWHGSAGPWRGYYFTHMEGSCRVAFIARWPGKIPAGRVSNEIVHGVDTFATWAALGGGQVPTDRAIDGLDQSAFLLGDENSAREGFPVYVADRLEAVKWRNFKMSLYSPQRDWWTPSTKLTLPLLTDLINDPKEEYSQNITPRNSWVATPMAKLAVQFLATFEKYPPIEPGTRDPYVPPTQIEPGILERLGQSAWLRMATRD
jgi:arylsulfatase